MSAIRLSDSADSWSGLTVEIDVLDNDSDLDIDQQPVMAGHPAYLVVAVDDPPNGTATITGSGTVEWAGASFTGSTVTNDSDLSWESGTATFTTFTNNGTFRPVTSEEMVGNFINNGTVSPGASPGMFNIDGNFEQSALGTLLLEVVSAATPGTTYDALSVTGDLILGGTMELVYLAGYTPSAGESLDLLSAGGSTSGAFSSVALPAGTEGSASIGPDGSFLVSFAADEPPAEPVTAITETQADTSATIVAAAEETTTNLDITEGTETESAAAETPTDEGADEESGEEEEVAKETQTDSDDADSSEDAEGKKTLQCTA